MIRSPNQKHKAQLTSEGEIRFGPQYFRLVIDGRELQGRTFGDWLCWSDDSRYLAAQEWLTLDYQRGPITRVLLIDVGENRFSEFVTVEKGFVENFRFVGDVFIYLKHFRGAGGSSDWEVAIGNIQNWKPMS